jgi:hypothetical protein
MHLRTQLLPAEEHHAQKVDFQENGQQASAANGAPNTRDNPRISRRWCRTETPSPPVATRPRCDGEHAHQNCASLQETSSRGRHIAHHQHSQAIRGDLRINEVKSGGHSELQTR